MGNPVGTIGRNFQGYFVVGKEGTGRLTTIHLPDEFSLGDEVVFEVDEFGQVTEFSKISQ